MLATARAARTLNIDEAIDAVGNTATAQSAALAWCRSALGCEPARLLHTGDELEQAVRDYAMSYRPVLVVLAPHDGHAAWIRTFVTRTRVAVLVARERVAAGLALVATDLQDASHAVLWRADELLSPSSAAVAIHVLHDATEDARVAVSRLREAVCTLRRPTETSVVVGPSVAGAILEEARTRRADLVVVGAHRRREGSARVSHRCVYRRATRRQDLDPRHTTPGP